jgi:hypothetical protein
VALTLATGQKAHVAATKALGTTVAGGTGFNLDLYICYRSTAAGSAIQTVGSGILNNAAAANTRQLYSMSAAIAPPAGGTYAVGLCGNSTAASSWNSNEWGYVTALVFQ